MFLAHGGGEKLARPRGADAFVVPAAAERVVAAVVVRVDAACRRLTGASLEVDVIVAARDGVAAEPLRETRFRCALAEVLFRTTRDVGTVRVRPFDGRATAGHARAMLVGRDGGRRHALAPLMRVAGGAARTFVIGCTHANAQIRENARRASAERGVTRLR